MEREKALECLSGMSGFDAVIKRAKELFDTHYGRFDEIAPGHYRVSTGGWSENEEVIDALKCNIFFWTMYWYLSKRGGHYEFKCKPLRCDDAT